jgi:hypothetical protein
VAELSYFLDRALAIATVATPMVLIMALLWAVGGRTFADPLPMRREEDPPPRWRLDR